MGAPANDNTTPSPLPRGRYRLVFSDWICGLLMYSGPVRQLARVLFTSVGRVSGPPGLTPPPVFRDRRAA